MKKQFVIIGIVVLFVCGGLSGCTSSISGIIGEWSLLSYGDADNPTYALSEVNTSIQFNSDHTFGGNVGCNIFGGDWKPTIDGGVSFSNIISTEMYCEETWEQESAVLGLFSNNVKLKIIWEDNDTMIITNGTSSVKLVQFIQGFGTIRYIDFEGGFYGIIGDNQKHYDPINLPELFKQDNLRVEFKARVLPNQNSIHIWGELIYILKIE